MRLRTWTLCSQNLHRGHCMCSRSKLVGRPITAVSKLCVCVWLILWGSQGTVCMHACVDSVRLAAWSRGSRGLADAGALLKLNTPNWGRRLQALLCVYVCLSVSASVRVCVSERERERDRKCVRQECMKWGEDSSHAVVNNTGENASVALLWTIYWCLQAKWSVCIQCSLWKPPENRTSLIYQGLYVLQHLLCKVLLSNS